MRIILDTGVLWRPDAIELATGNSRDVILPIVAFIERSRQYVSRGWTVQDLRITLEANDIEIEPLTEVEALKYSTSVGDDRWNALSRDSMIAGHIKETDEVWTTNPKDFLELGVPAHQVVAVP